MGTEVCGQLISETYPEACFDSVFLHKFLEGKKVIWRFSMGF